MSETPPVDYVTSGDLVDALKKVGEEHDDLSDQHKRLVTMVTELAERVTSQSKKLAALSDPDIPGGRARWRWRTLEPGPARTALWYEVAAFVTWYNARYGHSSDRTAIWPCWPHHPVVVEEVTALMVAHDAAYAGKDPTDSIIAWHDRWLWPTIDRLHTRPGGFAGCSATSHEIRHTVDVDDVDGQVLADAIAADTTQTHELATRLQAWTPEPEPAAGDAGPPEPGELIPPAEEPPPEWS